MTTLKPVASPWRTDTFRRLATRYERRDDIHLALLDLACALICFRTLQPGY